MESSAEKLITEFLSDMESRHGRREPRDAGEPLELIWVGTARQGDDRGESSGRWCWDDDEGAPDLGEK
jgi:hypothetical protein